MPKKKSLQERRDLLERKLKDAQIALKRVAQEEAKEHAKLCTQLVDSLESGVIPNEVDTQRLKGIYETLKEHFDSDQQTLPLSD